MALFSPTIILRHRKENLKKCSLKGLETRKDLLFLTYPISTLPSLQEYVLLTIDAPPLSKEDSSYNLFLVDATWHYAARMLTQLASTSFAAKRSIPSGYQTAYPRYQKGCSDPARGLATVEALFIACTLLKRDNEGILDHYYWKEEFIAKNFALLQKDSIR